MLNLHVNIKKIYSKDSQVSANINYTNSAPSVIVLFGPSGSGKSTILRCLAGLEKPSHGQIEFNGQTWIDTTRKIYLSPQERHIGYLFQDYALFPHLTIFSNITYGLGDLSKKQQHERAQSIIHSMQLEGLEKRFPKELSGGQQQRVALARALVCRPKLLLLDEPLSALDGPTREILRIELKTLLKSVGIPTVIVTHDLNEAVILAEEIIICSEGKTLQKGLPQDVLAFPKSLAVAKIVGFENILPGKIIGINDCVLMIQSGNNILNALGNLVLHQNVLICIRSEDVNITKKAAMNNKSKNHLNGIISHVQDEGSTVRLTINCGFILKSLLTRSNFFDMKLKLGMSVVLSIKDTSIHVIPA